VSRACCAGLTVVVDGVLDRRHICKQRWWQPVRPVLEVLELRRGVVK
jgi:hypothetical protein